MDKPCGSKTTCGCMDVCGRVSLVLSSSLSSVNSLISFCFTQVRSQRSRSPDPQFLTEMHFSFIMSTFELQEDKRGDTEQTTAMVAAAVLCINTALVVLWIFQVTSLEDQTQWSSFMLSPSAYIDLNLLYMTWNIFCVTCLNLLSVYKGSRLKLKHKEEKLWKTKRGRKLNRRGRKTNESTPAEKFHWFVGFFFK